MRRALVLAAATAALLLSACGGKTDAADAGQVFARSAPEAARILLAMDLPFPLLGSQHAAIKTRTLPDGKVELAIADDQNRAQLRFDATLTPVNDTSTNVAVAYAGAGPSYAEIDQRIGQHPEVLAVYLKTIREQVAADLEGRPFRNAAIGPEMMAAVAANAGSIARDMKAAGDEYRKRDRENIAKAYAAEARGEY